MAFASIKEVQLAFAQHLMMHCFYSEKEAMVAVSDFPDPYSNCFLFEDYVGTCEINGEEYEKRASYTNLWRVIGMQGVPEFRFYTYYRCEDVQDRIVGSYRKARKLYQIKELDKDDFPDWDDGVFY